MTVAKSSAARCFVSLMLLISGLNATLFTYSASTPLVAKDAWYFLDTFVREYFNYSLDITDFFAKRGVSDHAQPIQKLILLFHLRYFELDFVVEAMIGVLFGTAGAIAALRLIGSPAKLSSLHTWSAVIGFSVCAGAIPALALSLSSPEVFTWSLVTLGYMMLGLAVAYFSLGAHVLAGRARPAWLYPMALFLAVALDNLAVAYIASFVALCLLTCGTSREWRLPAAAGAFSLAGSLSYDLIIQPLLTPPISGEAATPSALLYFADHGAELWKLAWHPANTMFVSSIQLEHPRPFLQGVSSALAALLIGLHALFWLRIVRDLRYRDAVSLTCAGLVLAFYATVAAIAFGRVPVFGFDYLMQPRYYVSYLLGSLPILVLAAHAWLGARSSLIDHAYCILASLLAILAISVQPEMSRNSWERFRYISEYTQRASRQMGMLRESPEQLEACADILTVCEYAPEKKKQLIGLLADYELNIFNRSFQLRHRLYPEPDAVPTP